IIAWIVALGDLLVSCCYEAGDDDDDFLEQGPSSRAAEVPKASSTRYGQTAKPAEALAKWPPDEKTYSPYESKAGVNPADITMEIEAPAPSGGWNAGASKPFGGS
ncbi:unnamed protein product, partial [Polarella glacialis]